MKEIRQMKRRNEMKKREERRIDNLCRGGRGLDYFFTRR